MKILRPLIVVAVLAAAGAVAIWWTWSLRAREDYEKMRTTLEKELLKIVTMDEETLALESQIRLMWKVRHTEIGGVHSDALTTLGFTPSVSNLAWLLSDPIPPYAFFSPRKNQSAAHRGMVQTVLLPFTTDGCIHVSSDGRKALIRMEERFAYLFTDEQAGLRETLYVDDQAISSETEKN